MILSTMVGLLFPQSSVFISDYVSSNQEYHILASVLTGMIMCKIVYNLTGVISLLCIKGYDKLNSSVKIEWKNRGFSTFHAVIVAFVSLHLLLLSDLFDEESRDGLIIFRTSILSNTILGVSIGYFLSDLAMILWHFPVLGGLEYVIHHGLSIFSIILALFSGQSQIYILMVLFSEATTPFVNLRWYLEVSDRKSSKLYICNGIAMFLGWLVARVILFVVFFIHMYFHFDQVKLVFPLGFWSLLVVPPTLAMMNLFWFWKITKGLIKTLSKARHRQ